MNRIHIKRGVNLPLAGVPDPTVLEEKSVTRVAVLGGDYPGLKPRMAVQVGDRVQAGDPLFVDKDNPAVQITAPACGVVSAVHRGERRVLVSVVIDIEGEACRSYAPVDPRSMGREALVERLAGSGLWTGLRSRPFGRVAHPEERPAAIFVTAMDTEPLAPPMSVLLQDRESAFLDGLAVLKRLTEGKVYVCSAPGEGVPCGDEAEPVVFEGPHPAGLPGTHIHFLEPVHRHKSVWHIGLQDVIALGRLFTEGALDFSRIVAFGGPEVRQPRLLRTRLGASLEELIQGECLPGLRRIISGSALNGHAATGPTAFLGRYHQIVTVLSEDNRRRLLGWLSAGWPLYSLRNMVASRLLPKKTLALTTARNGGHRAIVPIGNYEKVMPLDLLATPLLKALASRDLDEAEALGALELIEEDMALATLVCPGKIDHGENLRAVLDAIQKEG